MHLYKRPDSTLKRLAIQEMKGSIVGKGGDDGTGKGKGMFAATRCAIQSSALWKCVSVCTI